MDNKKIRSLLKKSLNQKMIIKVLGSLDIFIGICFWIFGIFGIIPAGFMLILGLFLLFKGFIFITKFNIASVLDIVSAGVIIFSTAFHLPFYISMIVAIYLLQKGIFSWVR